MAIPEGGEPLTPLSRRVRATGLVVKAMLDTGRFFDVLPTEKAQNDDGTVGAIVETRYLAPEPPARGEAPAGGRGGRP